MLAEQLPAERAEWAPGTDADAAEKALLERYMRATEEADIDALKQTLAEEVRFSMPPGAGASSTAATPWSATGSTAASGRGSRPMRCVVTRVNRQPAVACYLRRARGPGGRSSLDVLRVAGGEIAEIVTFPLDDPARYGLPEVLA